MAHGEEFSAAVESIWSRCEARKNTNLVAVGVNCINPDFVSTLFKSIKRKVPLVVYPNSGELNEVYVLRKNLDRIFQVKRTVSRLDGRERTAAFLSKNMSMNGWA